MSPNMPIIRRLTAAMFPSYDIPPLDALDGIFEPTEHQGITGTVYAIHTEGDELMLWTDEDKRDDQYMYYLDIEFDCKYYDFASIKDAEVFAYTHKAELVYCVENEGSAPTPSLSSGESFGHPYCPPSSGISDELENHIVNVAHTAQIIDPKQWELNVLEVVTHPEYQPGITLDIVFARYRTNPDVWGQGLLQGMMAVHQYECHA